MTLEFQFDPSLGLLELLPGNDRFSGFGQQRMLNGGKCRDELRLPTGRYELIQQKSTG